jgi:hypothetical protein
MIKFLGTTMNVQQMSIDIGHLVQELTDRLEKLSQPCTEMTASDAGKAHKVAWEVDRI